MSDDQDSYTPPPRVSSIEAEPSEEPSQGPQDPPIHKSLLDSPLTSDTSSPNTTVPNPDEEDSIPAPDAQFNVVRNLNTEHIIDQDEGVDGDEPDDLPTELSMKPDESESLPQTKNDDADDNAPVDPSEAPPADAGDAGEGEDHPENIVDAEPPVFEEEEIVEEDATDVVPNSAVDEETIEVEEEEEKPVEEDVADKELPAVVDEETSPTGMEGQEEGQKEDLITEEEELPEEEETVEKDGTDVEPTVVVDEETTPTSMEENGESLAVVEEAEDLIAQDEEQQEEEENEIAVEDATYVEPPAIVDAEMGEEEEDSSARDEQPSEVEENGLEVAHADTDINTRTIADEEPPKVEEIAGENPDGIDTLGAVDDLETPADMEEEEEEADLITQDEEPSGVEEEESVVEVAKPETEEVEIVTERAAVLPIDEEPAKEAEDSVTGVFIEGTPDQQKDDEPSKEIEGFDRVDPEDSITERDTEIHVEEEAPESGEEEIIEDPPTAEPIQDEEPAEDIEEPEGAIIENGLAELLEGQEQVDYTEEDFLASLEGPSTEIVGDSQGAVPERSTGEPQAAAKSTAAITPVGAAATTSRAAPGVPYAAVRADCALAGRELVAVFVWVAACQSALVAANSRLAEDTFPGWKPFTLWIGLFVGLMTVWESFNLGFGSTLNPSVSIACYLARGTAGGPGCQHRRAMTVSLCAQLFAHFAGIYSTRYALGTPATLKLFAPPQPSAEVLGYGTVENEEAAVLALALAIEALATFAMCFVILYVGHKATSPVMRGGSTVLIIGVLSVVFSSTTGAVMNPMQHLALAMVERSWRYHLAYLVGPVVGAWAAAKSFNVVVGDKAKLE